jgi:hypothetical protein
MILEAMSGVADSDDATFKLKGNAETGAAYVEVLSGGGGGAGTSDTLETTQVLVKNAVEAINTATGEVSATPTANTVLARLKDLLTGIVLNSGTNVIGNVGLDQTTPGTTDSVTVKASAGIGSLTETAPATDTASSGLNGRLQRIAQNITSLIGLLPTALTAGGNLKTAILEALPAGTNSIGKIEEQTIDITTIQNVAIGATSAASLVVGATTNRVTLSASSDCWVAIGADPTAAAHDGAFFLASGAQSYPIKVTPSTTKIAVIQDSAAGYLSVIESE